MFNEPVPSAGSHQLDCREGRLYEDFEPLTDLVSLRIGETASLFVEETSGIPLFGRGGSFVFFPIWLRESSLLSIEFSDMPGTRSISLSDVDLDGDDRNFGFVFATDVDNVAIELQAGIYCFRSEEGSADITGSEITLRAQPL